MLGRASPTSASLIGRLGQALSGYPPLQCRCRSRARASLRTRHQGPSIMGFEDEVEQSFGRPFGRPCRQCDGRSKQTYDLLGGLAVSVTAGPSRRTISPHPSSREGHHSTAGWNSIFLLLHLILHRSQAAATSLVHRNFWAALPSV